LRFHAIAILLLSAIANAQETVVEREVKPGDPDRAAIMDVLRPPFEKLFGAPIVFRVNTLSRAGAYVYANTHALRAPGKEIEVARWKQFAGAGECFATRFDFGFENILEKRNEVDPIRRTRGRRT
jgi:hypothetical protein